MSKTAKHTPGPWKSRYDRKEKTAVVARTGYMAHLEISFPHQEGKDSEWKANACLIAAAPELLAALIRLREWVRNPGEDDSPANEAVIHEAEAAIAKATPLTPTP